MEQDAGSEQMINLTQSIAYFYFTCQNQ